METEVTSDGTWTPATRALREQVSQERWATLVERAQAQADLLERVEAAYAREGSWRKALAAVAPEVPWPTYQHWVRRERSRDGAPWERQLDRRVPPSPPRIPDPVRAAAVALRRARPGIRCADARQLLRAQFGADLRGVSDTSLKRIWMAAGVARPRGGRPREEVEHYGAGGGLAFVLAASEETGTTRAIAELVERHAEGAAEERTPPSGEGASLVGAAEEHRDAMGQFTSAYNQALRQPGERDPRWDSDAVKRSRRAGCTLSLTRHSAEVLAQKWLTLGAMPLVTERRGFAGLGGPSAEWLGVLGRPAYRPATMQKYLAELAQLGVSEAVWTLHGRQWLRVTEPWRTEKDAPGWRRWVAYIDATQDPYWTHHFAASGKVSRVGRTMPCLTRVALMGGDGVPLLVETRAGMVRLKKELPVFLERADAILGEGELGRLTVVDAEMATTPLLTALLARCGARGGWFITVLKGALGAGASRTPTGTWKDFRERDQVRPVELRVRGKAAPKGGLVLRGVEMERKGSRNPTTTTFVTNAPAKVLTPSEVASAYLSRWPHQEGVFRNTRNGAGLNRSHGYGGSEVAHVALETAQEKADRSVAHAEKAVARAQAEEQELHAVWQAAPWGAKRAPRKQYLRAGARTRRAERAKEKAVEKQRKVNSLPRTLYVRDTTRDSLATCAKLHLLMLIEFVLKEYFGSLRMEVRTYIEAFVHLPVTVRTTRHRQLYQLHEHRRHPAQMAWLREACAEVTRRKVRVDGRLLQLEVVDGPSP